ncbi:MAG: aminopeptidase P N-terminal domain-containing protein [Gammaproteobacteria bacterium]|nr:M24 family metallopeptidase [Sideroxydans sp.]MBU3903521.1 aminopeptidase P N-terminal domain-containing protein [Gammaproteobacteria bacterium]MBU4045844.1 aminopeptidase P N-terminal domain-containing protein [Gammaproteobacteria bacterium]MBU4150014.1 aminopeptidase P N-terminal domain-containing protein [Gammaproteobacteria bacterium]
MPDLAHFQQRRRRLSERMGQGIAVIPTAPEVARNADAHYDYRHDSHFYYLSGFAEPEAVLVLIAGKAMQSILFCREKNPEREIWDGFRNGPDAAAEHFGFDAAYPIAQLDEKLAELMADQPTLYYPMGASSEWDARLLKVREAVKAKSRSGIQAPSHLRDVQELLNEMRLIKDYLEQGIMRRAATISCEAHRRAMRFTRPGQFEYEVEAELLHEFCSHGARHPAYTSIVAGGANACTLHYVGNNAPLHDGDLLLIDAGCELEGYAADITRTFPINGKFSAAQKDVYQIVLASQEAAISAARPGNTWDAPHQAALRVLAQGFIDLKLCQGSVESVLETESYKQFYMHRTGHWLGMDVHDVGEYKVDGQWRTLQSGMTLTVEPGCYIRPADNVPQELWNIGIRIEDDVLITPHGNEVLTQQAPKTVEQIEEEMRHE